ncbi:hypothetical protein Ahy_B07g086528 [Arachis hypogaea]|uniref:MULE transposase domain-containing protein n=1 Tax=Arachis hypogaea TaxID=3818 RepID=A0A444Y9W3_ARAHY|nr:hypothetical protein Ahy_B07g086528 [Arachis hypogaea]
MVTFTKQDMYNKVRRQRALQNGDVNAAIRFLEGVGRVDGKMFWRHRLGPGQHLCDLFWSDGRNQYDYGVFGDVLAFNATYGRNKYNLPVVVFSGSVITDGDPAMCIAVQRIFPTAHHRLCVWHLLRNVTSNICDPRFTQLFKHCMLADIEIDEFEVMWEAMLEECGVRKVEWVQELYRKKYSWATAYIRGRFFAGIRTTSRCESLHAKLGRFVESRYGVIEFVMNFQRCVDFLRDMRMIWNFVRATGLQSCKNGVLRLPCVHILAVLVQLDVVVIPYTLVLRRWSKTAKIDMDLEKCRCPSGEPSTIYRTRLGAFSQLCKRLERVACMSDEDFKFISQKVVNDTLSLEMKYGLRGDNSVSNEPVNVLPLAVFEEF